MLQRLAASGTVTGCKQVRRAVTEGRAGLVYLASDADPALTEPLRALCREHGVAVYDGAAMRALGRAAGIAVGAAAAAVPPDEVGFSGIGSSCPAENKGSNPAIL